MPSFDLLLRRITPRHSVPAIPATPETPLAPAIVEPQAEEPGFFRQALIETRLQWARDVQHAAAQPSRRSVPTERVVFTDQYVPPPPRRPSGQADAVGWWD
jgi:hypothetical protein